ncbi:MAG TPA: hypothetical protein VMB74_08785 [Streptosporangiaceae bacterium]|nr:hypothetical protein [Streptosporangiaceae bacterium]
MDETSLRAHLELAVSAEPPLGHLVGNSLRAGRRLRRRRAIGAASLTALAVVLVSAVSALAASADHAAGRPHPAATGQTPETGTAFVAVGVSTVVPISLATNTPGTPIQVPEGTDGPFITNDGVSRNGRIIYEVGQEAINPRGIETTVAPIDTATDTAGRTITIKGVANPLDFALAPDGKTAYLSAGDGRLFRINLATRTSSMVTGCSRFGCRDFALTPNGKSLYVISGDKSVVVIQTATSTMLARIKLPASSPGAPFNIGITPDGKFAYVVDSLAGARPGTDSVVPIDLTTNTALPPIKIWAAGFTDGLVIAPDGKTAYVLSSRGVTAIDTATNQAEATIKLPDSAGYAYYMVLAPNGRMLYVLTPRGIVPIRTASGTVLPTIKVPHLYTFTVMAITPDGRTIYVGADFTRRKPGHPFPSVVTAGVVPVSTSTDTAGPFINLGKGPESIAFGP